jgi:hypothetical protein
MTLQEKILVAAYRLSSERGLFPVEDLIIRSWKDNPKDFSIKGYIAVYPDSNKVISCLFGQRGIIKGKGWLEAAVFNQYALTDKGKREAERLLGVAKVNADANGNEQV